MQTKACNLYIVRLKKRDLTDNPSTSYLFFNFVNEMVDDIVNDTSLWRYKQQTSNAQNYHDQKETGKRRDIFKIVYVTIQQGQDTIIRIDS